MSVKSSLIDTYSLLNITFQKHLFGLITQPRPYLQPIFGFWLSYIDPVMFSREESIYCNTRYLTSPLTISEPQNPWIDEFYVVEERRATILTAPEL